MNHEDTKNSKATKQFRYKMFFVCFASFVTFVVNV